MSFNKQLLSLALGVLFLGSANATVVTYDDLGSGNNLVPAGYQGLNWTGFYTLNNTWGFGNHAASGVGFVYGACCGASDTISAVSGTFNLIDGYFSTLQNYNAQFNVYGYLGGVQTYAKTVSTNAAPTRIDFEFLGVDRVVFQSTFLANLAVDNLQVSTVPANRVPEPTSIALVCLGLAGAGLSRRKSKKQ